MAEAFGPPPRDIHGWKASGSSGFGTGSGQATNRYRVKARGNLIADVAGAKAATKAAISGPKPQGRTYRRGHGADRHPRRRHLDSLSQRKVKASALMCAAWALLAEPPWPPSMFS